MVILNNIWIVKYLIVYPLLIKITNNLIMGIVSPVDDSKNNNIYFF